jgi:hypothetical protein
MSVFCKCCVVAAGCSATGRSLVQGNATQYECVLVCDQVQQ